MYSVLLMDKVMLARRQSSVVDYSTVLSGTVLVQLFYKYRLLACCVV